MKAVILLILFLVKSFEYVATASKTTADRIHGFGYNSESHNVVTPDGYILTIYRVKPARGDGKVKSSQQYRPVVLMMHGLTASSDCWIINGPKNALAFNLVDSGYDVWLGNSRGTPYANRHVSLSPNDKSFWRFSWHEIGNIDLPTMFDYILKTTQQTSLHYVGHSQGTAILFVLLSTRPSYNKKLKTSHLFAPIAYMKYARSLAMRIMAPFIGNYSALDPILGDGPMLQQPGIRRKFGIDNCRSPRANPNACSFLYSLAGGESAYTKASLYPAIFSTQPASCSAHQFIHLVQLYVSGRFRQYDYGLQGNLQHYNRTTPPDYKVSNINPRFPLNLYYSDADVLSSKTDCEHISRVLGKRSIKHFINLRKFAHFDFMWAYNVKSLINVGILQNMNEAENSLQKTNSNLITKG